MANGSRLLSQGILWDRDEDKMVWHIGGLTPMNANQIFLLASAIGAAIAFDFPDDFTEKLLKGEEVTVGLRVNAGR